MMYQKLDRVASSERSAPQARSLIASRVIRIGGSLLATALVGTLSACSPSEEEGVTDGDISGEVVENAASALASKNRLPIRINVGGGVHVDLNGNKWNKDTGFNTGTTASVNSAIGGTEDDALYQSNRFDPAALPELSYAFDVPNGDYQINLHFAETWSGAWAPGKRVFGVKIEGQSVESKLDIFAAAGANTALVKSYTARVSDGQLTIDFVHDVQNPTVSAIEVLSVASAPSDAGSDSSTGDGSTVGNDPAVVDDSTGGTESSGGSDTAAPTPTPTPVNAVPIANADSVDVDDGVPTTINVLANDTGLTDLPLTLTIAAKPVHGTASVTSANTIVYTATSGYAGDDSLTYQISDGNGGTALASVSIHVACTSCPTERVVNLSWNPNPDSVTGYQVFRGPTVEQATLLVSDLPLNSGLIDPTSPLVQYRSHTELGLNVGEQACFRIKAYNSESFSDYSQAVCGVI